MLLAVTLATLHSRIPVFRSVQTAGWTLALAMGTAGSCFVAHGQQPDASPVNPDATPAARALLREIDAISGHATLSGQHNFPNTVSRYSDRVYELTERYPALFGQDFGFSGGEDKDSILGRPAMIEEVIRQYRAGAVIALTWHAVRPTDDEPVTFHDSVQGHLSDWEWHEVLTPGTDLNRRWCRQVDLIAGYLSELQDAGVPVLFRPYHEMNGNWFWWGGRPGPTGSAALYRQLYDRYVHMHHLNNLIWVWNVNSPSQNAGPVDTYYPGPGFADVLSMDIYGAFEQRFYDSMIALAGPRQPIALAEVGALPSLEVLAQQPRWTYLMMWSGMAEGSNTPAQLQAVFHAPNVADRGDARLVTPVGSPSVTPTPVSAGANMEAIALLTRLAQSQGGAPLLGQSKVVGSAVPAVGTVATGTAAIAEFTLRGEDPLSRLPAMREAAKGGQILFLRWMPGRPTDESLTGMLTEYEWQQLVTPGSDLNVRWTKETTAVATLLRKLQDEHLAVLWSPFPESNLAPGSHAFWWSGRPGQMGSAALVRILHEQFTAQDGLHNLIWNWEPATPGFGPGGNGGFADFYPGPLYTDTLTLDQEGSASRFPADRMVAGFSGVKPIGVRMQAAAATTAPSSATGHSWQWIVSAAGPTPAEQQPAAAQP